MTLLKQEKKQFRQILLKRTTRQNKKTQMRTCLDHCKCHINLNFQHHAVHWKVVDSEHFNDYFLRTTVLELPKLKSSYVKTLANYDRFAEIASVGREQKTLEIKEQQEKKERRVTRSITAMPSSPLAAVASSLAMNLQSRIVQRVVTNILKLAKT